MASRSKILTENVCYITLPDYDVPILTEYVCNIRLPDYDVLILTKYVCNPFT